MKNLKRNFLVYCITNFIWAGVFNLWYQFFPKFYEALGASVVIVGFLFSLERFFEGSFNIIGGHLADVYGRKKIIIFGSLIGNISLLILFFATNWLWLIPAIVFFWTTVGVQTPAVVALINESIPRRKRAFAFATLSFISSLPVIFTAPIGGLLIEKMGLVRGIKSSVLISFFVGISCTLVYMFFLKETLKFRKKTELKIEWKLPGKIFYFLISYGLLFFSVGLVSPFVIFYSTDVVGINMFEWGIVEGFFTIFMILMIMIGGIISDKFGRRIGLLLSFISSLFPVLMILSENLFHILLAHIFASTFFLGNPSIPTYTFEKSRSAKSIGIVVFVLGLAMTLGYSLGGFLYSLSPQHPFIISALLRLVGLILGIFFI